MGDQLGELGEQLNLASIQTGYISRVWEWEMFQSSHEYVNICD